ncbi:DUF3306 domain-containing protein [Roseibium sp. MMSF_3544]|uniref:DUF3306 domain-containing protein n=1 Tax=unclassified Roseibium TaxID=2629323 RepID=UPI00273E5BC8|nr:DUF3306 domain-containing protein [Roseibium sp. MMSF_3544]
MSDPDETGGDFWSRRKAAVRKAEEAERAEKDALEHAEMRAELEQKSDEEILEELGLPDPDTLSQEDDFSKFLSAAVPERLRRRALRRLWGINPVLANLDGLVDYADDFTDAATVVENLQTVYQIGKGMLEQFADGEDPAPDGAETVLDAAGGTQAEKTNMSVSEDDFASHNAKVENKSAPVQLTQDDDVVQPDKKHEAPSNQEETDSVEVEYDTQVTRRRLRFDYS